jgi:exonuclease V
MPVFGFVQNQPVVGIIVRLILCLASLSHADGHQDEIHYLPSGAAISLAETGAMYTTLRKKKRKSQAPDDPSQASLTRFFPTSPSKLAKEDNESPSVPEQVTTYDLYLVDTKTRRSTSLPPDEDTVSSRLQLMLYRRLLSALLSTFDFDVFWAVLGVDSAAPLSPRFAQQVGTLVTGRSGAVERLTLDGLAAHWVAAVHDLGIARVSPRMTLVYRAQALRAKRRRLVSDTADLQAAVQASLQDAGLEADPALVKELASSIASPSGASGSDAGAGGAMKPASEGEASRVWALQPEHVKDTVLTPVTSIPKEHAASGTAPSDSIPLSGILGTKEFALDDAFLDAHLAQTLGYWYGLRQPEGVPVELSRRCLYVRRVYVSAMSDLTQHV